MAGARRHSIQWGFISPCHPGHSPLTQLSAPLLSGAPHPGVSQPPSPGLVHSSWAQSLGGRPRPTPSRPLRLEEGKGRKMQRGPLTARSTM